MRRRFVVLLDGATLIFFVVSNDATFRRLTRCCDLGRLRIFNDATFRRLTRRCDLSRLRRFNDATFRRLTRRCDLSRLRRFNEALPSVILWIVKGFRF